MGKTIIWATMAVLATVAARGEVVATARSPEGAFTEFRVVLDAEGQPGAVANFTGLADGSQAWMDPETRLVRGGAGDAFYGGMVFDWHAGSMLRGGLRGIAATNGTVAYTGGPGYTATGKEAQAWEAVPEGGLMLVEDGGPHCGGGEIALALTNGTTPWTLFGRVSAGDEAGLRELAAAMEGGSPVEVEWEVDESGATEAETAALAAARENLPRVRVLPTGVTAAGVKWSIPRRSVPGILLSTNPAAGWTYYDGVLNEGDEEKEMAAAWEELGLGGGCGFAAFTAVEYPQMPVGVFSGKIRIGVEHSSNLSMQYWLDFDGMTGVWAKVEGGAVADSGTLTIWEAGKKAMNCLYLSFGMGMTANYYYLGLAEAEATRGRFMSRQQYTAWTEDWGNFEMAEGWGEEAQEAVRRLSRKGGGCVPVTGFRADTGRRAARREGTATFSTRGMAGRVP